MDLGTITERVLVFGGPYSNLQALEALKSRAEALGIPADRVLCTGDIVAYCGQPCESVELIRDWGIHVLMGNCEESFGGDAEDCGCGFSEGSSCDLLSAQWFNYANSVLNPEHRQWLAQLPRSIHFTLGQRRVQLVHGSAEKINRFIFPSDSDTVFKQQFTLCEADIIIGGHSGLPFVKTLGSKLWLNAGAIGMPANDGQMHTWYSLLSPAENDNGSLQLDILPLHYDAHQAREIMLQQELDNGYAEALISGFWPSMDVLPAQEQTQQGKALSPISLEWAP